MAKDSKQCNSRRCGGIVTTHTVTAKRKGRHIVHVWVCANCGKKTQR